MSKMVQSLAQAKATENSKVGVDVESISAINVENEAFIDRNFTVKEQQYSKVWVSRAKAPALLSRKSKLLMMKRVHRS